MGAAVQNRDWLGQSALHFRERLMHHSLLRAGRKLKNRAVIVTILFLLGFDGC